MIMHRDHRGGDRCAALVQDAGAQRQHLAGVQHVRSVAVGDRVLYGQDDHFEVDVSGRTFVVLRERDLHAVASAATESTRSSSGTGLYL